MKKILIGLLVSGAMLAATAETELTKVEQGRRDISLCYAHCGDRAMSLSPSYISLADFRDSFALQLALAGLSSTEDIAEARRRICGGDQRILLVTDMCQAGCRDLEAVYGTTRSWAKTRFVYHFNEFKANMAAAGLWTTYRDYPRPGYEFDLACDNYLGFYPSID